MSRELGVVTGYSFIYDGKSIVGLSVACKMLAGFTFFGFWVLDSLLGCDGESIEG